MELQRMTEHHLNSILTFMEILLTDYFGQHTEDWQL